MSSKENEGDKKVPLSQKEAELRKSLVADNSGNYSVTYDLFLTIRKLADKIKDEKHNFEGYLDLTMTYYPKKEIKEGLFLNFVGEIHSLEINGKIVDSIIIGFICFIFCKIVDMPYAVLISVIIGVTNIIPFFGPFIGAIPSAILVLVESPNMCLVFIIFIIVLQQVDGNIIGPLILGDSIGLSSFWVLFAIIVGGNLFGFAGMVLGVPTFACVYALLTLLLRDGLNKNGLANDTQYFVALRGFDENGNPIRGPKKRFENSTEKAKRAKKLEQIQHSKELFEKVTHHESKEKSGDKNKNKK
jgi:hypothetical protein